MNDEKNRQAMIAQIEKTDVNNHLAEIVFKRGEQLEPEIKKAFFPESLQKENANLKEISKIVSDSTKDYFDKIKEIKQAWQKMGWDKEGNSAQAELYKKIMISEPDGFLYHIKNLEDEYTIQDNFLFLKTIENYISMAKKKNIKLSLNENDLDFLQQLSFIDDLLPNLPFEEAKAIMDKKLLELTRYIDEERGIFKFETDPEVKLLKDLENIRQSYLARIAAQASAKESVKESIKEPEQKTEETVVVNQSAELIKEEVTEIKDMPVVEDIVSNVSTFINKSAESIAEMAKPDLYAKAISTFSDAKNQALKIGVREEIIRDAEDSIKEAETRITNEETVTDVSAQKDSLAAIVDGQTKFLLSHINSKIGIMNAEKAAQDQAEELVKQNEAKKFEKRKASHPILYEALESLSSDIGDVIKESGEVLKGTKMENLKNEKNAIDFFLNSNRDKKFSTSQEVQDSIDQINNLHLQGTQKLKLVEDAKIQSQIDNLIRGNNKLREEKKPYETRLKLLNDSINAKKHEINGALKGVKDHLQKTYSGLRNQIGEKVDESWRNNIVIQFMVSGVNAIVEKVNRNFDREIPKVFESFDEKKGKFNTEIGELYERMTEFDSVGLCNPSNTKDNANKPIIGQAFDIEKFNEFVKNCENITSINDGVSLLSADINKAHNAMLAKQEQLTSKEPDSDNAKIKALDDKIKENENKITALKAKIEPKQELKTEKKENLESLLPQKFKPL